MSELPAIEFRGVHKAFRGNAVLRGLDLRVRQGQTFTILGGSGSGKSVCLKHMIGLLGCDAGAVSVFGQDVTRLSERRWVELRRNFGMVFQGAALFDSLDVYENVAYPIREHMDWSEDRVRQRVRQCLEGVGLGSIEALLPPSCRAACASAAVWRARSRSSRASCCTTNPRRASIRPTRGASVS
jgi:phospholipid/cholesterol/gamma-HCH transport system ATP-binding protein